MPPIKVEHCKKQLQARLLHIDRFVGQLKDYRVQAGADYVSLNVRTTEMMRVITLDVNLYVIEDLPMILFVSHL